MVYKKGITQKGTSYAIVKFSDLSSVFELFIFSDIFELNRNILNEGNCLLLTLTKNVNEEDNRFKKVNLLIDLNSYLDKSKKDLYLDLINSNKEFIKNNKVDNSIIENIKFFEERIKAL